MVTTLVAEWMVMAIAMVTAIAAIAAVMASIARALAARVLLMMPVMKRMASSTLTARMSTAATGQRNAAAVIQMSARVSGFAVFAVFALLLSFCLIVG